MRKTAALVLSEVANKHGLTVNDLKGPSRLTRIANPRQEAYYEIFVQCPHLSYPEIARRVGGRDHTSVLHGVKRHCERVGKSYEDAKMIRNQKRDVASIWIRSTVLPQCAQDYRRASSIYAQGVSA